MVWPSLQCVLGTLSVIHYPTSATTHWSHVTSLFLFSYLKNWDGRHKYKKVKNCQVKHSYKRMSRETGFPDVAVWNQETGISHINIWGLLKWRAGTGLLQWASWENSLLLDGFGSHDLATITATDRDSHWSPEALGWKWGGGRECGRGLVFGICSSLGSVLFY